MKKADYDAVREKLIFTPNNFLGVAVLVFNITLFLLATFFFSLDSTLTYWFSQVLFALHFNHSYLLVHEASHYSFFSNRRMNVLLGHTASIFAFLPFYSRQFEHSGHHRWVGSFREPSTQRALNTFSLLNNWTVKLLNFCWRFWVPIFAINEHIQIWRLSFEKGEKLDSSREKRLLSAFFLLIIYMLALTLPNALSIALNMLPALLLYFILIEFLNLPHHIDSKIEDSNNPCPLWQQEAYSKSYKPLPFGIGRFLFLDFNYHVAHHYCPNLPWHELNSLQKELVALNSKYGELEDELTWSIRTRKQPIHFVFKKYIEFQSTDGTFYPEKLS